MTTTADKIKVMQASEDGQQIEWRPICCKSPWLKMKRSPTWGWGNCEYRIKPDDPKPLECWVTLNENGRITSASINMPQPIGNATMVPVREVTPQDEKDRKDAARYRKAKEISCNTTTLSVVNVSQWDKVIDKAMENQ